MSNEDVTISITFSPATESRTSILSRFKSELDAILAPNAAAVKRNWRSERMRELRIQRHTESPTYQRNRDIYDAYRSGGVTLADLGRKHGISTERVGDIIRKERSFDAFMAEEDA